MDEVHHRPCALSSLPCVAQEVVIPSESESLQHVLRWQSFQK